MWDGWEWYEARGTYDGLVFHPATVGISANIDQIPAPVMIALINKDCINAEIMHFYPNKCQKCVIKILMHPRTQDVDLKNSLHLQCTLNLE